MTPKPSAEGLRIVMPGFAPPMGIDAAIHDALSQVLPETDIRAGVELDRLRKEGDQWKGHVEFLLLLDSQLLHVEGTLIEGPKRTLRLSHQAFPVSALRRVVVTTDHEDQTGKVYMRAVQLVLHLGDGTSFTVKATLPEGGVELVLAFARSLVEALK